MYPSHADSAGVRPDRAEAQLNRKMEKDSNSNESKKYPSGTWVGTGIAIGVALGAAFDNVGLGIALGISIGAAIEGAVALKNKKNDSSPK